MSNQINDGGPAFALGPTASTMKPDADGGGHVIVTHYGMESGMSLRDYFAAAALPEVDKRSHGTTDDVARECYQLADAMLKAREVKL